MFVYFFSMAQQGNDVKQKKEVKEKIQTAKVNIKKLSAVIDNINKPSQI